MGYRNYIGYMPKREYNKIKSLTVQEVYDYYGLSIEEEDYKGVYDFGKELYEFGKYVDFKLPEKSIKSFFKKKETQDYWGEENDFYVVTEEFLAYIIDNYKEKIRKYYDDMTRPFYIREDSGYLKASDFLSSVKTNWNEEKCEFDFTKITDKQQVSLFKVLEHIRSMWLEWHDRFSFDLEKGEEITTSWMYEYAIFELIRIYKSFNWRKNVMIYYGY